jgi:hypothetical protein
MAPLDPILRTKRTYATYARALKHLEKMTAGYTTTGKAIPYFIAATPEGRFAPVVFGIQYLSLAHVDITVCG